jgi:FkbM family methyltransferase
MITVKYNTDGIRVEVGNTLKYNTNQPYLLQIKKHVSGEVQWETKLFDGWFATFPNTEMYDVVIMDSKGNTIYTKRWDIMEHGNHFYKSLWLYNKSILSKGNFPKGLVIGTHDGEFGEWVPLAEKRECNIILVEASDKQFKKLTKNYKNNSVVKTIQNLVTPDGGKVEFFEGGEGYTNTVIENVIRHWEKEEIKSTTKDSISITDLILNECDGKIDWLHLDVEGLDAKLIMGIDETKVTLPSLIIFEDYNLSDENKNEIHNWFKNKGYQIYSDGGICEAIKS